MEDTPKSKAEQNANEIFQRVWSRVMPHQPPPAIETLPKPFSPQGQEEAPPLPTEAPPQNLPAVRPEAAAFPLDALPQLGSASAPYAPQLLEMLRAEVSGARFYKHLAGKRHGQAHRTLSALAQGQLQNAKKLAAAYFLLTGIRYWPKLALHQPRFPSYLSALRRRFGDEQRLTAAYKAAADHCRDSYLQELFQLLAAAGARRAQKIPALVEQG